MLIRITEATAPKLLGEQHEYSCMNDDQLLVKLRLRDDLPPLGLVIPTQLPIDGDGKVFIPGDITDELPPCHKLYDILGADREKTSIFYKTGIRPSCEPGELVRLQLTPPDDATRIIIIVFWEKGAMPTGDDYIISDRLGAEFMYRRDATDNLPGIDVWVTEKTDLLAADMQDAQEAIDHEIFYGDIFARMTQLTAPLYQAHMNRLLLHLSTETDAYYYLEPEPDLEYGFLQHVWLISEHRHGTSRSWGRLTRFSCDLHGVQDLEFFVQLQLQSLH